MPMTSKASSVSRSRDVFVHAGRVERGELALGDTVKAQVDRACRRRAQANHTATHLLQAALKQVVDPGIGQAGSLVDFDRLRFDFHCPTAVTADQLQQVETLINGWINEAHALQVQEMAIEQAKAAGAVAMFGEKYADVVRVVDVPGVSMELCGGDPRGRIPRRSACSKIVAEVALRPASDGLKPSLVPLCSLI